MSNHVQQMQLLCSSSGFEHLQSDWELLELFVESGDREAIERLIQRYAPMVASVCQVTSSNPAAAEDAFQATFLVLLRSASKIRKRSSVAAWLHGVAYRTSVRLRAKMRKQLTNQEFVDQRLAAGNADDAITQLARQMDLEVLDRELETLPERLRAAVVEHYLLGYSAPEIAQRMELSVSAVEGRLRRGRSLLRTRLAKRGISLSVLVAGSGFFQAHLKAAEAHVWTQQFLEQHFPVDQTTPPYSSDPTISSLIEGETAMFKFTAFQALASLGCIAALGTLATLSVGSNGQSQSASANSGKANLGQATNEISLVAPVEQSTSVLAQFGGPVANQAPTEGIVQPAMSGNIQTPKPKRVEWQAPEKTDNQADWVVSGSQSTASIARNREKLLSEISLQFVEQPLGDVFEQLSAELDVDFEISSLEHYGIDKDEPITFAGKGTARELLQRILKPLDLTYFVRETCIEIGEPDQGDLSIRYYDLSFVMHNDSNLAPLYTAIQSAIEPGVWLENGGASTISFVGSIMIVATTEPVHTQIENMLYNLQRINPRNLMESSEALQSGVPGQFGGGSMMGGMGGGMGGMGGGMF
ncbi:MAG: RNA polymerase sigma factor [Planctomycetales bacterium]|nr:RNA polymerase sigma factor [Planctomycetales bacterium]